jgi:hypothetical protein
MSLTEWVSSLSVPVGQSVEDTLRAWYYDPQVDAREAPMSDWSLVCCVCVPSGQHLYRFNVDAEDPYARPYYLFYSFRPLMRILQIWGGIAWHAMAARAGCIDIQRDLVATRAFLPYWEAPSEPPIAASKQGGPYWLPMQLPRGRDCQLPTVVWPDVVAAYRSLVEGRPSSSMALLMAPLVEAYLVATPKEQFRLHTLRLSCARAWLAQVFRDADESSVLSLLATNGLDAYMDDAMLVQASPRDRQRFLRAHPASCPPVYVFRVPMEEMCGHTSKHLFDLHPGGLYHISYQDVEDWLWSVYCVQTMQLVSEPPAYADDHVAELASWTLAYFEEHAENAAKAPHLGSSFSSRFETSFHVATESLEQFLPPCLLAIARAPRFPKHFERFRLLKALQTAGVGADDVFAWFEAKHAAYPRAGTAKARFNYETAWHATQYGPPMCSTIIGDTLAKRVDMPLCPYVGAAHLADVEDAVLGCKSSCSAGGRPFSGPHNLIRRALYRSASLTNASAASSGPSVSTTQTSDVLAAK